MLPSPPRTTSRVAILSPGFPAEPGGVTDHTNRLQAQWTAAGTPTSVIGDLSGNPDAAANELRQAGAGGVLIQYVPFLYGRRGVSRWPERFARAARAAGLRVVVFVHEPWVPMTRLPWLVLGPLQRLQLRRLLELADHAVTPVPAWQSLLGGDVAVLYVGSALGPPPTPAGESLPRPVVFSPTAAGFRFDWVAAAAHAIGSGLTLIGTDAASARSHPQLQALADPAWDWRGRLAATDVMALLARARLVLAPFMDGATGRRTSLLSAMSAGARVVSSSGPLADPLFRDGPVRLAANEEEFVALAKSTWSAPDTPGARDERMAFHRRHFDTAMLDDRLLRLVAGAA